MLRPPQRAVKNELRGGLSRFVIESQREIRYNGRDLLGACIGGQATLPAWSSPENERNNI